MDVQLQRRLSRLEDELGYVQRCLSSYSGMLRGSWEGRDGQAVGCVAEQLARKSMCLCADMAELHQSILQAQAQLDGEACVVANI